ncbi:2-oxo-4-hydroxy-4-carboxy-5-ureidoimidazoline decarboxylase [candidate division KSB1 bacterium]|nr:2-oxo-4-hydroxy-4-carboxy-5-ureidoimidazoline decarboxylase [candidate division KSB1 bacterium]
MAQRFPFQTKEELCAAAEEAWFKLLPNDWLEAFAHHPKIGDVDSLRAKFASTRQWAEGEQAGVHEASEAVLLALAEGNAQYENKFGYIFIVCATGKSAAEMLAILQARLLNDHATELQIAAVEQSKITKIRLEKLLHE